MAVIHAVHELRAVSEKEAFLVPAPGRVAAHFMPLGVQGPVAFRAQVQQPVMPQVKRDGLVEVTEREVQWDEYVAGLGGGDDAVLNEEQAKVAIERVTIGSQPARLLDSVYASLDGFPKLPGVELQHHFVTGLRRHVGAEQGTGIVRPYGLREPLLYRQVQFALQCHCRHRRALRLKPP
ncbi:hypothetical protein D9M71_344850 [compost metagenome]